MKKIILNILIVLILIGLSGITVNASAPYHTRTLNRYGEMVQTQDAYEPIISVKSFYINDQINTFNGPQDIFIDNEDYIYVVDTKNKRIIIFDNNWNYLISFGEDILIQPLGIFVRENFIFIADYGSTQDNDSGQIVIYDYDKTNNQVELSKSLKKPESILLEVDNFIYRPQKIAVDSNYTMYIVSQGSSNGILLVNSNNRFLNYFAPNPTRGNFVDLMRDYFWGDNEKVLLTKKIPPSPTNVMLDDSGYIYTVTRTIVQNNLGDSLKKVNIGGLNFFPADMQTAGSFIDCWSSSSKTIYGLTANGYIYEYDIEGTLLFVFGGPIVSDEQLGLFKSGSALAVDSSGLLYIVDDNANTIQILRKTNFANKVHIALEQYMSGKYIESKELWEEVLRYNSMFDLAHKGIGLAYFLEGEYQLAMDKFALAYAKAEYSEAFWELRNIWLIDNMSNIFMLMVGFGIAYLLILKLNKKYQFSTNINQKISGLYVKPFFMNVFTMFKFIRHPLDAVYEVRYNKNIKIYNSLLIILIIFALYICHILFTGFLFNNIILERTLLIKEALRIVIPIVLFIVSNYLISSLMSGEGTLKSIAINTCGSLIPVIFIMPFLIVISNVLTYNESFIYYFAVTIMYIWTIVLLFTVIKETHNFTFKQTFVNLFITIFMMIIIIIVIILLYLIVAQVIGFVIDLIKEVIF